MRKSSSTPSRQEILNSLRKHLKLNPLIRKNSTRSRQKQFNSLSLSSEKLNLLERRKMWTAHPLIQHVQMRTVCQHMHSTVWYLITRTHVAQERTAQDCTHWYLKNHLSSTRHVSFLATPDTWPPAQVLPLTCLICLPAVLSHTVLSFGTRSIFTLRRFTAEWRIHWSPISHRLWAQTDSVQRHWALKNWAWQESWDRSTSHPGKNCGRWLSKSCHWRSGRIWTSWCRDAIHSIKDALRSLHTQILKMETYENAGFTVVFSRTRRKCWFFSKTHSFREIRSRGNTEERGKCTTYSGWSLKKRKLDVKFLSRPESFRETMRVRLNWEDLFLRAEKIIRSVKQDLYYEARTSSRISQ